MRRRPRLEQSPVDPLRGIPQQTGPYVPGDQQKVSPFLVSGGLTFHVIDLGNNFDPRPDGVQLVTSVYIPEGQVGFVKQIRVAPYMPPVFADPWRGVNDFFWRIMDSGLDAEPPRAAGQVGVWETPFAWEGYVGSVGEERIPTEWRWYLRYMSGSIAGIRNANNIDPLFSTANPKSWYLFEDVPVPASAYRGGLPGKAAGQPFNGQRMQVLQGDQLSFHIPIPQDTTLLLFTKWRQGQLHAYGRDDNGELEYSDRPYFPLLPSFGQLLGYTQPISSEAGVENARHGWGA